MPKDRAPTSEETRAALQAIGWVLLCEYSTWPGTKFEEWEWREDPDDEDEKPHTLTIGNQGEHMCEGSAWPIDIAAKTAAVLGYSSTGYSLEEVERAMDEVSSKLIQAHVWDGTQLDAIETGFTILKEHLQHHTGEQTDSLSQYMSTPNPVQDLITAATLYVGHTRERHGVDPANNEQDWVFGEMFKVLGEAVDALQPKRSTGEQGGEQK